MTSSGKSTGFRSAKSTQILTRIGSFPVIAAAEGRGILGKNWLERLAVLVSLGLINRHCLKEQYEKAIQEVT